MADSKIYDSNSPINQRTVNLSNDIVTSTEQETQSTKKQTLLPMSPLAASATVINLILATGPFR